MKKEIKNSLTHLGISIVYIFGSKVTGISNKFSDIDIGVVFKYLPESGDTRSLYNALYELFSKLFPKSKIDIVFLQRAPLSLQFFTIKYGKILFEENPVTTADYEYSVINQYLDFKSVLDFFDRIEMERYGISFKSG